VPKPSSRRARRATVAVALLLAGAAVLPGCSEAAFEPPQLTIELRDGDAHVAVRGTPGLEVYLAANRPWRGEHALYPGLVGLRCLATVRAEDRGTGAGLQLSGTLERTTTTAVLPGERLRALPKPAALQAVAAGLVPDGSFALALSNAFLLDERDGVLTIVPWTATTGLALERWRIVVFLGLPLGALLALRRLRRGNRPVVLLAAAGAAALAALGVRAAAPLLPAAESGEAAPPLWVAPGAVDQLDALTRAFGEDVPAILRVVEAARTTGEAVTVVLGSDFTTGRELLAAQLGQHIAGARVVRQLAEATAPGLALVLQPTAVAAAEVAGRIGFAAGAGQDAAASTTPRQRLAELPVGALWRLGAR